MPTHKNQDRVPAVPLVIGVTGHVDLLAADLPRIGDAVNDLFSRLEARFLHTPIHVLSPLAEGADRLVAQIALRRGAKLIVPLPMEQLEYEQDFGTAESLAEFRTLLAAAEACFVLPAIELPNSASTKRQLQYAQVGAFVAKQSQLLIALWDGEQIDREGGTGEVVRYMLEGVPDQFAPPGGLLRRKETGPVYHIRVRRAETKNSSPHSSSKIPSAEQVGECQLLMPPGESSMHHRKSIEARIAAHLDRLNCDIQRLTARSDAWTANRTQIMGQASELPGPAELNRLVDVFAVIDSLAVDRQQMSHRVMVVILACTCVAAISLQLNTESAVTAWVGLAIYAASLAAGCGCYWWSKLRMVDTKYLDYRAIAEGLRVQAFWAMTGLHVSAADYYLRRQQGVLEWIRNSLSAVSLGLSESNHDRRYTPSDDVPPAERKNHTSRENVAQFWLNSQHDYFQRTAAKYHRLGRKLERLARLMLIGGTIIAMLWPAIGGSLWSSFLLVIPPVLAAIVLVYANTRALSEHAYQFDRMSELFADAAHRFDELKAAGDAESITELLFEVGKEALSENADWLILHRDRPLDSPAQMAG